MISAPLCSKTHTFDGLGVQVGANVAARFGPRGGQDSKSGGLGGQEAAADMEPKPGRAGTGQKRTQLWTESEPDRYVNDQSYD